jgi:hypothetical protein
VNSILLLILGAIIGGAGRIAFVSYTSFHDAVGMAVALRAEIESVLAIVEMRRYASILDALAAFLESSNEVLGAEYALAARIEQDYFGVFHSVQGKIGLLQNASASVVRSYALAKSFLEDMRDLSDIRAAATTRGIDPQWLAPKVRGAHQALTLAVEASRTAVTELDTFSRQRWLLNWWMR